MGFSYDFLNGKNFVVYHEETFKELDEKVHLIIRANEKNFLPIEIKKENNKYSFSFCIEGTTNLRAWIGEADARNRINMKEKVQMSIQKIKESFSGMISEEQLITEEKYIYIDDVTETVRFICLPILVRKTMKEKYKEEPKNTWQSSKPFGEWQKNIMDRKIENSLPQIPPEPKADMIFEDYLLGKGYKTKKKEYIEDYLSYSDKWHPSEFQENIQEERTKGNPSMYEAVDSDLESDIDDLRDVYPKYASFDNSLITEKEEENDEGTVLLRTENDDEGTVLLSVWKPVNGKLLRTRTGEIFSIQQRECRIGKKESVVDIYIKDNPTISREHCVIRFAEGDYYIEDFGSKNYTYVDGKQLIPGEKVKLSDGCRIQMSDEEFIFTEREE